MNQENEKLLTFIRVHHLDVGETLSFNCPHCGEEVIREFKALELDPDVIEVHWGKSFEEIEAKKKKAKNNL
jgi:hypothetical protein